MIKYNLILVMLIVLIPVVYTLSIYFENASTVIIPGDNQEITETVPIDKPTVPDDNSTITQKPSYPQFKTGMQAVEYAIARLTEPISFECDVYHTTSCASIGSLNVLYKAYRYKNHEMMRIWSECSIPLEMGNFYKVMYSNCEQEQIRFNYDTKRFDLKEKTNIFIDSDTIDGDQIKEYIETDKVHGWNTFFTDVNNELAREIYFDKSNKNYYKVKVSLYQSKLNDSKYAGTMISVGALSTDMKKLNITFTIDKKTGYLISCTREEEFIISIGSASMINCTATGVQNYKYIDTKDTIINIAKQELNLPY